MKKLFVWAVTTGLLAACSSINSKHVPQEDASDGLTYYMPNKDFMLTVVVEANKSVSAALKSTAAYPDLSTPFRLRFKTNWIGKNVINIGVTPSGLLTSTKAVTTSGLPEALKGIAETIGTRTGLKALVQPAAGSCSAGTYTLVFGIAGSTSELCGHKVKVTSIPNSGASPSDSDKVKTGNAQSGIFYRQEQPYRIDLTRVANRADASQDEIVGSEVLFSPSSAPVRFLPMAKTFFSNNEADFGFTDGMPTRYDQTTDGEIVALLKLPAGLIGAYFGAVGKVFESFKTVDDKKAAALESSLALELAKKKYEACLTAIFKKDDALVQRLGCQP